MLKETPGKLLILCLVLGLAMAAAVVAGEAGEAGDDEVIIDKDVKVIVKKIGDCEEGEDCEGRRVKVFVGEDGEVHELVGDAIAWVGDHHGGHGAHVRHLGGHHGGGGFLGVGLTELTPELRAHFGVPEDAGVMVSKVVEDSPAHRAGLQVGDIISGVGGEAVASGGSLASKIRGHEDGAAATLEVWRDGRVETFTATIEERKRHRMMRISGHGIDYDCDGAEDCKIEVDFGDGDYHCTVNGESIDCQELHGEHSDDE